MEENTQFYDFFTGRDLNLNFVTIIISIELLYKNQGRSEKV
jgi:hypothetical protein